MSQQQSDQVPMNGSESADFGTEGDEPQVAAWTEIETGRFQPRRVRGSFRGRALG